MFDRRGRKEFGFVRIRVPTTINGWIKRGGRLQHQRGAEEQEVLYRMLDPRPLGRTAIRDTSSTSWVVVRHPTLRMDFEMEECVRSFKFVPRRPGRKAGVETEVIMSVRRYQADAGEGEDEPVFTDPFKDASVFTEPFASAPVRATTTSSRRSAALYEGICPLDTSATIPGRLLPKDLRMLKLKPNLRVEIPVAVKALVGVEVDRSGEDMDQEDNRKQNEEEGDQGEDSLELIYPPLEDEKDAKDISQSNKENDDNAGEAPGSPPYRPQSDSSDSGSDSDSDSEVRVVWFDCTAPSSRHSPPENIASDLEDENDGANVQGAIAYGDREGRRDTRVRFQSSVALDDGRLEAPGDSPSPLFLSVPSCSGSDGDVPEIALPPSLARKEPKAAPSLHRVDPKVPLSLRLDVLGKCRERLEDARVRSQTQIRGQKRRAEEELEVELGEGDEERVYVRRRRI